MRAFQRNGIESAKELPDARAQAHYLQVALSEMVPPRLLEQMREDVRADLARQEDQRLRAKDRSPSVVQLNRQPLVGFVHIAKDFDRLGRASERRIRAG
jgi:hypothetical protein